MKERAKRALKNYIFPLILLVYPLIKVNQGIDLTDSCYGLVNFRFFPYAGKEWTVATYLANAVGALLVRLPFGDTLIGIRIYTGLLVSAMALLSYYFLKGKMSSWIAFLGEFVAVGLCWIPTTSLYNYLTFFLFLCGSITLYRGLIWHRRSLMAMAGVFLGLSVLTRLPNILECGLILTVFYYGILKKKEAREIGKDVAACVAGFAGAFAAGFVVIGVQLGFGAYGEMLTGLSGYGATDASYSPVSMLASIAGAYVFSLKWVLLLLVATVMGVVMFLVLPGRFERAKMAVYVCMLPVLLRLLWGRGMFDLNYAFYWSVMQWCMVLLYMALWFCIRALLDPVMFRRDKLLALFVLLIILITPIGSNNETYPNMNNLFLAAPVTFWFGYRYYLSLRFRKKMFPVRVMLVFVLACILVQSAGFGMRAVFRDSIEGQRRDSYVTGNKKLAGVRTNAENAAALQGVVDFVREEGLAGKAQRLITFGDVPGFGWIFDMPSELSHDWPDMNTYPAERMRQELEDFPATNHLYPLVIVNPANIDMEDGQEAEKWRLLQKFMGENAYGAIFDNGVYRIYGPEAAEGLTGRTA